MYRFILLLFVSVVSYSNGYLLGVELTVTPDRADGVYAPAQHVTWTIAAKENPPADLAYSVKIGGLEELATGTLSFIDDKATVSATLSEPGTLLLSIPHDKRQSFGGAAFDWQKIPISASEPKDFDAFWTSKLAELATVPIDPQLELVDSGDADVQLWKITMGNIRGSKIHGYLARPVGDAPCPAMFIVQWAGVYPLQKGWSVGQAKNGYLVLNIMAHDLPADKEKSFYDEQNAGPLKGYPLIGNHDREKSYFLRMYLSCYRGADYLASRTDWNKKTLVVQGGSQGGLQSIVTGGLHPAVTHITANVPAGCDHTGTLVNRTPGWPGFIQVRESNDLDKITETSTYYDVVNFARRVKCPTLVGMGLIDTTCSASGVFAMFNQIAAPKRIVIMPTADHGRPHDAYYKVMGAWLNAAKDGKPVPME